MEIRSGAAFPEVLRRVIRGATGTLTAPWATIGGIVILLTAGDMLIVPRGVEHRPVADEEVEAVMFGPVGTLNTGNVTNARTLADPVRIWRIRRPERKEKTCTARFWLDEQHGATRHGERATFARRRALTQSVYCSRSTA